MVYSADLEHLATNSATPLPQTWSDLLETPRRYLFALGSSNSVSDAVLAHYLSAGGRLTDDQGNPVLDETALRTLLETYQKARDAGVLPGNFVELDNADKVWNAWRGLGTAVANLNATRYLSVETRLPDLQVGDLPALIQPAQSVGRGWAYAIVTKDPRRQAAAARLLQQSAFAAEQRRMDARRGSAAGPRRCPRAMGSGRPLHHFRRRSTGTRAATAASSSPKCRWSRPAQSH